MTQPMDDFELDRRLDALSRSASVAPGNWAAIESRIHRRRWPVARLSAIAAAAVLAGVALVVSQIAPEPVPSGGMAEAMQAEVQAMRASAPAPLAVSAGDSPAALVAAWQENQQAIVQLEQAMEDDPGNRLLLEFLTEARMRQARLVRSASHHQTLNDGSITL